MTELCLNCGKPMVNLGNVDNIIFTSNPPQWNEVLACHGCQIKKVVRRHGELSPDLTYLNSYKAA